METRDLGAGGCFATVGLIYGGTALFGLPMGSALEPGPAAFPVLLSALLILIGGVLILRSLSRQQEFPFGAVPWRPLLFLSLASVVFALILLPLGLPATVVVTTMVASLAQPRPRLFRALVTGIVLAVFSTVLFAEILRLQVPVRGHWIGG